MCILGGLCRLIEQFNWCCDRVWVGHWVMYLCMHYHCNHYQYIITNAYVVTLGSRCRLELNIAKVKWCKSHNLGSRFRKHKTLNHLDGNHLDSFRELLYRLRFDMSNLVLRTTDDRPYRGGGTLERNTRDSRLTTHSTSTLIATDERQAGLLHSKLSSGGSMSRITVQSDCVG